MPIIIIVAKCNDRPPADPVSVTIGPEGGSIGRAPDCNLVLSDPTKYISRFHAQVLCQEGRFVFEQIGRNASLVNGRTVAPQESAPLASGDYLIIGPYQLLVEVESDFNLPNQEGSADLSPGDMIDILLADEVFALSTAQSSKPRMAPQEIVSTSAPVVPPEVVQTVAPSVPPDLPQVEPVVDELPPPTIEQEASQADELASLPSTEIQEQPIVDAAVPHAVDGPETAPSILADREEISTRRPRRVLTLGEGANESAEPSPETFTPVAGVDSGQWRILRADRANTPAAESLLEDGDPPELLDVSTDGADRAGLGALDAANAFFEGARIEDLAALHSRDPDFFFRAGALLREVIASLQQARGVPHQPNELVRRLSPSPDQHGMEEDSAQSPIDGISLQLPQVTQGVKAVVDAVLAQAEPAVIAFKLSPPGWIDNWVPVRRKAQLWELYLDVYEEAMREQGQLAELFVRAYHGAQGKQGDSR